MRAAAQRPEKAEAPNALGPLLGRGIREQANTRGRRVESGSNIHWDGVGGVVSGHKVGRDVGSRWRTIIGHQATRLPVQRESGLIAAYLATIDTRKHGGCNSVNGRKRTGRGRYCSRRQAGKQIGE